MRTLKHGKHEIKIYSSAEDMPMKRYQRFNKFLMIDNGVGSDFADFNTRSQKAIQLLKSRMIDDAIKELENRRQMVYNSFMEYSPRGRALAILIYSIDGEVYKDYSKETLDKILNRLEEIEFSQKKSNETISEVKKK